MNQESHLVDFFMLFTVIFIAYSWYESKTSELIMKVSPYDGNKYLVRNRPDSDHALRLISTARKQMTQLVTKLEKMYPKDQRIQQLASRFNPDNISETAGNSKYTSYSVNKGEQLVLCLRSKKNPDEFIDENTLLFVALHELSHIMTKKVGHENEDFWTNFRFLLKEAIAMNMYECVNYAVSPVPYCGIEITNNPLKCTAL